MLGFNAVAYYSFWRSSGLG